MIDLIFSWNTLWWVLLLIYVPVSILLMVIVLIQKGKGSGFGGAFGVGAGPGADTIFGPKSGRTLPVRLTYIFAGIFMVVALIMSMIANQVSQGMAPELVDEDGETVAPASELDALGIGRGFQGAGDETPATGGDENSEASPVDTEAADPPAVTEPLEIEEAETPEETTP